MFNEVLEQRSETSIQGRKTSTMAEIGRLGLLVAVDQATEVSEKLLGGPYRTMSHGTMTEREISEVLRLSEELIDRWKIVKCFCEGLQELKKKELRK